MRKYIFILVIFGVFSCDFGDTNVSPNAQTAAPKDAILAVAQVGYAYTLGDDAGRISNIITQHLAGTGNQSAVIDRYTLLESDINTSWNNFYEEVLNETKNVNELALADGSPHYAGIANVITAMTLGTLTDLWGDVPYSQALQGVANPKPSYDSQEALYDSIQNILDRAIVQLGATESATPDNADFIYGGDVDNWISTARVLKARYYNNLSQRDPSGSATSALAAISAGIYADPTEDCDFPFTTVASEQNPYAQFFTDRGGDASMGEFFIDLMSGNSDPRLPLFATTDAGGGYSGSPAGVGDGTVSSIGTAAGAQDAAMQLVTLAEARFIEAEAELRLGNTAAAQTAYQAGITASLEKLGVDATTIANYIAANGTFGANALEDIIEEKYVAMFTHPQPWTDWRRTGFPSISPAANNVNNNTIPVKFPYPQNERLFNTANAEAASGGDTGDINLNVWWDN